MNQTRYHGTMLPEGVLCQLERRETRKQDACHPSECPTCGWNLDKQEKENESDEPRE